MARTCTVCRHPQHQLINTALVAAQDSFRVLATQFSLSMCALRRHRNNHLPAVLVRAQERSDVAGARSLLDYIRALRARSAALLEKAEATGDLRVALGALRELRGIAELTIRAADRREESIPGSVVKAYVQKVVDVLHEFVTPDRIDAALMKLQHLTQSEIAGE
jgi:hypothetical protein